jgi:xylitol oxidase
MTAGPTNWAGNVTFGAARVHRPASVPELQELVAGAERVRALGTGHSFSRIADTTGDLVSVAGLPPSVRIDPDRRTVTVAAGVRYGELAVRLQEAGWALPNLASLPHISVAGACATGTHGSGVGNGTLATSVAALDLVTAAGELVTLRRDADAAQFRGAVVGLGALGVVTGLTLDLVPTFDLRQYVYERLPLQVALDHLGEVLAAGYSVSLFTDWAGPWVNQVWRKLRADDPAAERPLDRWLGAEPATQPRHPVAGMPAANCTEQLGVPGPWHERLPHFRLEFTPSSGDELQSEYFVPAARAVEAVAAIYSIRADVAPLLQISEIRAVAADDLWLSPAYGRDTIAIHFTWRADDEGVRGVLPLVEQQLAPFGVRPHWGKLSTVAAATVRTGYDRLADFRLLQRRYDPAGKFENDLVSHLLGVSDVTE